MNKKIQEAVIKCNKAFHALQKIDKCISTSENMDHAKACFTMIENFEKTFLKPGKYCFALRHHYSLKFKKKIFLGV